MEWVQETYWWESHNEVTDSLSQRYIILEYSKHMIIT